MASYEYVMTQPDQCETLAFTWTRICPHDNTRHQAHIKLLCSSMQDANVNVNLDFIQRSIMKHLYCVVLYGDPSQNQSCRR